MNTISEEYDLGTCRDENAMLFDITVVVSLLCFSLPDYISALFQLLDIYNDEFTSRYGLIKSAVLLYSSGLDRSCLSVSAVAKSMIYSQERFDL
uniref:Uncharacterized protein n=1 Tax=Onchocerca volvulus TaxID=6282 RepID=A0A8R1TV65_ONCVO